MQRFNDRDGVANTIEEVRIPKGDVLGAGCNLATNVLEHHVTLHDTECAVVYRHDWAVTAAMQAST